MSRIIRDQGIGSRILIGDRKHDPAAEIQAEDRLGRLFPLVAVMTQPNGSKVIPIEEVRKIEEEHLSRLAETEKTAREQGYKEGQAAGLASGLVEAKQIVGEFKQAVSDAVGQRETMLEESRQHILELIMKIARKVTYDAIELDPEAVAKIVAHVIDQLIDKSAIKIKINPDHLPIMEQYLDRFLSEADHIKDLSFSADPRVRYGGCFIETPSGDIDARLSSQFEVIEQTLNTVGE